MLLILPNLVLAFLEGIATWCVTRKFHVAKAGSFDAITHFLTMGGHIGKQRRLIAGFRRRGDFWMLRFFRLGFGRWDEVRKILKAGFPQFKS
jgi:hypothetical protein